MISMIMKTTTFSMQIPPGLKQQIAIAAQQRLCSLSDIVRSILMEHLAPHIVLGESTELRMVAEPDSQYGGKPHEEKSATDGQVPNLPDAVRNPENGSGGPEGMPAKAAV
jgi:hypothetical protein